MPKAKGTRVSQREKQKMWVLYQDLGSYKAVANKMKRSPDTVAKYVSQKEAEVSVAQTDLNAALRREAEEKARKEALIKELLK